MGPAPAAEPAAPPFGDVDVLPPVEAPPRLDAPAPPGAPPWLTDIPPMFSAPPLWVSPELPAVPPFDVLVLPASAAPGRSLDELEQPSARAAAANTQTVQSRVCMVVFETARE